ncbi:MULTISPECIES: dihydroneopterin aldolase [unclassified Microbacterium]|uniref:dihydroneopterin aldolase n=1 Tax=unclassified Microbacterium TaxID=2609290 RepID=UPI003866949E
MSDEITVTGIRAFGYHGVYAHERREGQEFIADVTLSLSTRAAAKSDDVLDTVHYGELAEQVAAILSGEPANLVETVAERIATAALAWPIVDGVTVTIHKPSAPIEVPFADVTVTIRRHRENA